MEAEDGSQGKERVVADGVPAREEEGQEKTGGPGSSILELTSDILILTGITSTSKIFCHMLITSDQLGTFDDPNIFIPALRRQLCYQAEAPSFWATA